MQIHWLNVAIAQYHDGTDVFCALPYYELESAQTFLPNVVLPQQHAFIQYVNLHY
jgi:hypothetical protein